MDMTEEMLGDEKLLAKPNDRFALDGPGQPEDVAAVVAFRRARMPAL